MVNKLQIPRMKRVKPFMRGIYRYSGIDNKKAVWKAIIWYKNIETLAKANYIYRK
jgi:hypothetical protein